MNRPTFKRIPLPFRPKDMNRRDYLIHLIAWVGGVATTCSGAELPPARRYAVGEKCLFDAAGNTPSKPWEYVPLKESSPCYHNNMRDFIKAHGGGTTEGVEVALVEALDHFDFQNEDFYVYAFRDINMVWYQLSTHRVNSPLKQSKRFLKEDHPVEYWFPPFEDMTHTPVVLTRQFPFIHHIYGPNTLAKVAHSMSPKQLTKVLRKVYKRKELRNRDHNAFELVNFTLCGTKESFENLFRERSRNTCGSNVNCGLCEKFTRHCAQLETRMLVADIEADMYDGIQGRERYFQ